MRILGVVILGLILISCTNIRNRNMGIFNKYSEKKENSNYTEKQTSIIDTSQLTKTAEMLDENVYWSIIEKSLKNTNNQEDQEQFLKPESDATSIEIIGGADGATSIFISSSMD